MLTGQTRWSASDRFCRWNVFAGFLSMLLAVACVPSESPAAESEEGFVPLFDGKTLDGWDGNPKFWSVEEGAITGQTTPENPAPGNTFIIWRGGSVADFELKLQYRIVGHNSGIQYRSEEFPDKKWVIGGYQADFEAGNTYSGILYEERFRGILAKRGEKVEISPSGERKVVGSVGDTDELQSKIKKEDWNEYHIIARGRHLIHKINGHTTVDVIDNEAAKLRRSGLLAFQLHAGPPMKVQFKDVRLKRSPRKVVFIAGTKSHGYGAHEHRAGCLLLAGMLEKSVPDIDTEVVTEGYPKDTSVFDDASAIVVYADGGARHPLNAHLSEIDALTKRGVGLVCLHYGVEVPKGPSGDAFLDWIGGYFETDWSVNPHWTARYNDLPQHDITRGVSPFSIEDEWYYHMRFRDEMQGVTPILTDLPSNTTLSRPDGPHSGNPAVRKAIANGEKQHMAWAATRPDGGRGFGFTGGHFHWNWGHDEFRQLVLNAITWAAGVEVPDAGVSSDPVTVAELEANQDYPKPDKYNPERIQKMLDEWNGAPQAAADRNAPAGQATAGTLPRYHSPLVTTSTPGHTVEIDVDIKDAKTLFLVVEDGGNGISCDWADWIDPKLITPTGEQSLTTLKWKTASTGWGQVRVNANANGGPLRVAGRTISTGIGAHSNSVIAYDLPAGVLRFQAKAGLDEGGTSQSDGRSTTVRFAVYVDTPPPVKHSSSPGAGTAASHELDDALAGLDVGEGLQATLFAGEPLMLNPTNIDIDHLGRVWVCEVVNYRKFRNTETPSREAGDCILVLEDSDGDGRADKKTIFYQGTDIDSAHGVCVLGNRVIVSAGDKVLSFYDDDGDLKSDRKEVLFSGISGVQHDHGIHAFVFGPDGRLYFNFGNAGAHIRDASGQPITDLAGNVVDDTRHPYQQGMVFRCQPDGSQFETLGWNFRNNWEVAVDSFGGLWQSDNDDDGNRGVRINYVMEFGNYGYVDEKTGAGWRTPRTGMHEEIPLRHWHLNDPGVVPNLLQTGAGSPTGLCVYEGDLLPERFRNQMIHCDAGPNVVRAYPVKNDGAGYTAHIENVLVGTRDNWFRPSDVCVAPDGSLIIADWYDPGVGGHRMGDLERGRLFRVAPPQTPYAVPPVDFSTPETAAKALTSPNLATRYLAYEALREFGPKAEPSLRALLKSDNPRFQARALWLLAKLPGQADAICQLAISDENPDIRITGLRIARDVTANPLSVVKQLTRDPSPQVRRECAITLRFADSPEASHLWAELALQHQPEDRWSLEALGIGAELHWDACLSTWMKAVGDNWTSPAGRQVVWRSRAQASPELLATIIARADTPDSELPRLFRAFDFQPPEQTQLAVRKLIQATAARDTGSDRSNFILAESLTRLTGRDIQTDAELRPALDTVLKTNAGSPLFVELVQKFSVADQYPALLQIAVELPDSEIGVQAIQTLLGKQQVPLLTKSLSGETPVAVATAQAMGNSGDGRIVSPLWRVMEDSSTDTTLRRAAATAIGKTRNGALELLKSAEQGQLDVRVQPAVAAVLHSASWADVKQQAGKFFPLPASRNNKPLPPLSELVSRRGNVDRGRLLFNTTGTCAKCHVVNGLGKEVGPNLSEIGKKLSREAMLQSILFPSAGISHNYETYVVLLASGNQVSGIMTSQSPESITIKGADAIAKTFPRSEIEEIVKQDVSLMPADLQKVMTGDELIDVVEYMTTLKQAERASVSQ